jgi:hypothetical protein
MSFIVQATVIAIVNYDRNTCIALATLITIVNCDRNTSIVQTTGQQSVTKIQHNRESYHTLFNVRDSSTSKTS